MEINKGGFRFSLSFCHLVLLICLPFPTFIMDSRANFRANFLMKRLYTDVPKLHKKYLSKKYNCLISNLGKAYRNNLVMLQ